MGSIAHAYGQLEAVPYTSKDFFEVWDMVRPGLEKVKKHGNHWRIEDIYLALKLEQAVLHIFYEDQAYRGCMVTMTVTGFDGPILHIWAVYSECHNPQHRSSVVQTIRQLMGTSGAKRATFHSPRAGWDKIANELGFQQTMKVWEMEA